MYKVMLSNAFEMRALVKFVINALRAYLSLDLEQPLHLSCPTLYHTPFVALRRLLWWRMPKMERITSEFGKVPIMGTSNMGTLKAHRTGHYGIKISR